MAKIELIGEQLGIAKVVENCPRAVGDCKPFYSHLHVAFAFQPFLLYGPLRAEYHFGMIAKRKLFKCLPFKVFNMILSNSQSKSKDRELTLFPPVTTITTMLKAR